jgi:hypothetical protein
MAKPGHTRVLKGAWLITLVTGDQMRMLEAGVSRRGRLHWTNRTPSRLGSATLSSMTIKARVTAAAWSWTSRRTCLKAPNWNCYRSIQATGSMTPIAQRCMRPFANRTGTWPLIGWSMLARYSRNSDRVEAAPSSIDGDSRLARLRARPYRTRDDHPATRHDLAL